MNSKKKINQFRAKMTLEQDEMKVLKGKGILDPGGTVKICYITPCSSCSPCDALSNTGYMKGSSTKAN